MAEDPEKLIRAKALDWDGDIGLRISQEQAARVGIKPWQELVLRVLLEEDRIDVSRLSTFSDGRGADGHDALLAEARLAELERQRQ